ncbi:phosphoglucomutase/phosphomannomutase, alpha/beta/alpha domain I family protein [Mycobacterium xenopi 3993]|nr:phosphoglucomutase/phosphomannomutase, alpha/beta/alpha domain I family protein [Mycobacterium xenopi 3993]
MTPEEWIAHDPDPATAAELAGCEPVSLPRGSPDRSGSVPRDCAAGARRAGRDEPGRGIACDLGGGAGAQGPRARRLDGDRRPRRAPRIGHVRCRNRRSVCRRRFSVLLFAGPIPTPVLAFAVRRAGAAAGIQITASHNPPSDNGYKVYLDDGIQIVSPVDRAIETAMATAPFADQIARAPVESTHTSLVDRYIERTAGLRCSSGSVRVALTPLHGVGGAVAVETLHRAGFGEVHTVGAQFAPDPDFPTVAFPNPEEPGATDALLRLAHDFDADIAVALDPDADRCAVGIPTPEGWRMLTGDETGWLLGDYILSHTDSPTTAVVASTVVSSRMLAAVAARHGARHVETLTGFKWLARADAGLPAAGWSTPTRRRSAIVWTPTRCATRTASARRWWPVIWWRRSMRRAARCSTCSTSSPDATVSTWVPRCQARWPARRGGGNHAAAAARATRPAGWICRLHNGFTAPHRRAGVFWQRRPHVGPGGGATVGHRTQAEVLPRSRLPAERGSSACS